MIFSCTAYAVTNTTYTLHKLNTTYDKEVSTNHMHTNAYTTETNHGDYTVTAADNHLSGSRCFSATVIEYDNGSYSNQSSNMIVCGFGGAISSGSIARDYDDMGHKYVHISTLYSSTNPSYANESTALYRNTIEVLQDYCY